jgi:hypothetical protein
VLLLCAGLHERLQAAEAAKGIKPDPDVAELMSRTHGNDAYTANVDLVLQVHNMLLPCVYANAAIVQWVWEHLSQLHGVLNLYLR